MNRLLATVCLVGATWAASVASSVVAQAPPIEPLGSCGNPRMDGAHPAVVRVITPLSDGTSYGSGTLVGHTQQLGLVVTNWHVVRGAVGPVMVVFPDGFRSAARLLRTDRDWDLAALAIWRPSVPPVPLATHAPQPGEPLTIAGYGPGWYRASAGRVVEYVAPATNLPYEMVEVSTGARQGDSGGPMLNGRGELAGVLFGTASGRTTGSYSGRVRSFLMTVLDDFQRLDSSPPPMIAHNAAPAAGLAAVSPPAKTAPPMRKIDRPRIDPPPVLASAASSVAAPPEEEREPALPVAAIAPVQTEATAATAPSADNPENTPSMSTHSAAEVEHAHASAAQGGGEPTALEPEWLNLLQLVGATRLEQTKTILAAIGGLFLLWKVSRLFRRTRRPQRRRARAT